MPVGATVKVLSKEMRTARSPERVEFLMQMIRHFLPNRHQQVLFQIETYPGITNRQIGTTLGMSPEAAATFTKELVDQALVNRYKAKYNHRWFYRHYPAEPSHISRASSQLELPF